MQPGKRKQMQLQVEVKEVRLKEGDSILAHRVEWLPQSVHDESNFPELGVVQHVTAIEDKGRLYHAVVDLGAGRRGRGVW